MRVPNPETNDTPLTFKRNMTTAFGPYANDTPLHPMEDDTGPYTMSDLCMALVCLFLILLVVFAINPSLITEVL